MALYAEANTAPPMNPTIPQSDHTIEASGERNRSGGLDRLEVDAVHEGAKEIECRIWREPECESAERTHERKSDGQRDPGCHDAQFVTHDVVSLET